MEGRPESRAEDSPPATPPRASSPNPSRYVDTRWGELEVEMGLAVEQEMAMLKVTSPHQAGVSRVSIEEESEQDAADDRERLRRLGSDSDSDEDDESLGRRAARANDALADLGRAKEQAKARIAQVRSVAAERAEKSTRHILLYAHPASMQAEELRKSMSP